MGLLGSSGASKVFLERIEAVLAEVGRCLAEVELFEGGAEAYWEEGGAV